MQTFKPEKGGGWYVKNEYVRLEDVFTNSA